MKKWIFILALAAGLSSCIYPYTPDIESNPEETLVVDGHILVGGTSSIRLSYLIPINGKSTRTPRALAWLEDNKGNRYQAPGEAVLTNSFDIPTHPAPGATEFRAVVEVDNETYTSAWITPDPAPEITDIRFTADASTVYVTVDLKPGVEKTGYAGFMLEETWEFHSDVYPEIFIDPDTWEYYPPGPNYEYPYYWCYRSVAFNGSLLVDYSSLSGDVIRDIPVRNFSRSDSRNHRRYSILVKGFALSKEAYDYNKQTQDLSQVGGDLFSPDPGALEGNLVCETHPEKDVMGFVQAGYVTTRRAFLSNIYLYAVKPIVEYAYVTLDDMPVYYYDYNYRPVMKTAFYDGVVDYGWAPHRCINCLEAGGTQEKPDFWD